eukprot:6572158-Ditylum_brightwellii.AAC.1
MKNLTANVIHVNHLHGDISNSLAKKATSSHILPAIQDEIHASVLCTNADHRLTLCAKLATKVGTPVPCSSLLDSQGLLVAMHGAVSIQSKINAPLCFNPGHILKRPTTSSQQKVSFKSAAQLHR